MSLIGFTRQETIALTGADSNRLSYLDRTRLVVPCRYGNPRKPTVIYSWEQVLEIRAINRLRKEVSLQTIRKIISYLNEAGIDSSLKDKMLIVCGEEVFWLKTDDEDRQIQSEKLYEKVFPALIRVANRDNKDVGQVVLLTIPSLAKIVEEIWEAARQSKVVDFHSFQERARTRPDAVA